MSTNTVEETKRRADCYPDLIATLKYISDMKRFLKPGERYMANDAECMVDAADRALAKARAM